MNKERAAQIAEKRYLTKVEKEQEAAMDEQMEYDRIRGLQDFEGLNVYNPNRQGSKC